MIEMFGDSSNGLGREQKMEKLKSESRNIYIGIENTKDEINSLKRELEQYRNLSQNSDRSDRMENHEFYTTMRNKADEIGVKVKKHKKSVEKLREQNKGHSF